MMQRHADGLPPAPLAAADDQASTAPRR
jgi:hypothetical protein